MPFKRVPNREDEWFLLETDDAYLDDEEQGSFYHILFNPGRGAFRIVVVAAATEETIMMMELPTVMADTLYEALALYIIGTPTYPDADSVMRLGRIELRHLANNRHNLTVGDQVLEFTNDELRELALMAIREANR